MKRATFVCIAIGFAIACDGKRTFQDVVKSHQAVANNETPELQTAVIQVAKRHVEKYEPKCRVQGVAAYAWAGTTWRTIVDCLVGESRTNVHLDVDLFIQNDGSFYWKTEYVPPRPEERPLDYVTEPFGH